MKDGLIKLFCLKINVELEEFKSRLMDMSPCEVYDSAYMIDCMINLEEVLLERSIKMRPKELRLMINVPNLLNVLYQEWLDVEDSRVEELEDFVDQTVRKMAEGGKAA